MKVFQPILGFFIFLASLWLFALWARSDWVYADHWAEPIVAALAFTVLFFGPVMGGCLIFTAAPPESEGLGG